MAKWSCNYSGTCEPDPHGTYETAEECQATCQGLPNKDIAYHILSFDLENARYLAPSDQAAAIKRFTGVTVHPADAPAILKTFIPNQYGCKWPYGFDVHTLKYYPQFRDYLAEHYPYALYFDVWTHGYYNGNIDRTAPLAELTEQIFRVSGLTPAHFRHGDFVRFNNSVSAAGLMVYNERTGLFEPLGRRDGFGKEQARDFSILRFPRLDYFDRLSVNLMLVVRKADLPPLGPIQEMSGRTVYVMAGPYKIIIYSWDVGKFEYDWASAEEGLLVTDNSNYGRELELWYRG